jgi:hypothetical protein
MQSAISKGGHAEFGGHSHCAHSPGSLCGRYRLAGLPYSPTIQGVGVDRLRRAVGTFRNVIVARWASKLLKMWWPETGSNRRRRPFQGRLASELSVLESADIVETISVAASSF